ncbi:MAG: amino acid ABC transporter substrate-binding protein [Proteobacteria bacterium]|nr:amino acid ABC transporter substrate-binding protein [Pseudomonadota bacterium]
MSPRFILAATLSAHALTCTAVESDTLRKVADSGRISVGYRMSSVPFSYLAAAGGPTGFEMEISNAVVAGVKTRLGQPDLKVELLAVTPQNRISLLQNGTIDIECGSTTNNQARGKAVQFAINHFYTGTRLLVKKNSGIRNWADLAHKKVSSTMGTTNVQMIRRYSRDHGLDFSIELGKEHDDAMLLVDEGRAAAFAMDEVLLYGLKSNARNPDDWDVVGDTLQVEPYACMLRRDDPQFQKLVNGVIGNLMASGEFEKLYTKWFLSPIPPKAHAAGLPLVDRFYAKWFTAPPNSFTGKMIDLPMSQQLRDNLRVQSDQPAR